MEMTHGWGEQIKSKMMNERKTKMKNGKDTPKAMISMSYEAFDRNGGSAYLCPIRKGVIPFSEMECVSRGWSAEGEAFEITEVTEDTFSFVVPATFCQNGEPAVSTLSIKEGVGVYQHGKLERESIDGDSFTDEHIHKMVVKTAKKTLQLETYYGGGRSVWAQVPYVPGEHTVVCGYPYSGTGDPAIGHVFIGEDMGVRYLDDGQVYYFTEEMVKNFIPHRFTRKIGDDEIVIKMRLTAAQSDW